MAPLHSLTNLRTPARRVPCDGAPAVEELARFTIPKLKQPGGSTPASVPESASQQHSTDGLPQHQRRQAESKPGETATSVLPTSAGWPSAADARDSGSAVQAVQKVSSAEAGHAEPQCKQAGIVAAPQPAQLDAPLSAAAHAAGNGRAGLPPAGKTTQGSGTRRLLAAGGPAARRQTSHAPSAAKAALPLSKAKSRVAAAPAVQQNQPHTLPAPQLPPVAQEQDSSQSPNAGAQAGPGTDECANDSGPPTLSTTPPPVQQPGHSFVSSPAAQPPAGRQRTPAAASQPEPPARQWTPAAQRSTLSPAEDTPVSRYADAVSDASDGEAAAGGSPDYCPTGERRSTPQDAVGLCHLQGCSSATHPSVTHPAVFRCTLSI